MYLFCVSYDYLIGSLSPVVVFGVMVSAVVLFYVFDEGISAVFVFFAELVGEGEGVAAASGVALQVGPQVLLVGFGLQVLEVDECGRTLDAHSALSAAAFHAALLLLLWFVVGVDVPQAGCAAAGLLFPVTVGEQFVAGGCIVLPQPIQLIQCDDFTLYACLFWLLSDVVVYCCCNVVSLHVLACCLRMFYPFLGCLQGIGLDVHAVQQLNWNVLLPTACFCCICMCMWWLLVVFGQ